MENERTIAIIQQIREEAIQEQEKHLDDLQAQNELLLQRTKQLEQQLAPLLIFEPILKQTFEKSRMVVSLKLDEQEQSYLWAIVREWYPSLYEQYLTAKEAGQKEKNPIVEMFNDIVAWLIDGCKVRVMTELNRMLIDKTFPRHDA